MEGNWVYWWRELCTREGMGVRYDWNSTINNFAYLKVIQKTFLKEPIWPHAWHNSANTHSSTPCLHKHFSFPELSMMELTGWGTNAALVGCSSYGVCPQSQNFLSTASFDLLGMTDPPKGPQQLGTNEFYLLPVNSAKVVRAWGGVVKWQDVRL